jgi:hypothetical protein
MIRFLRDHGVELHIAHDHAPSVKNMKKEGVAKHFFRRLMIKRGLVQCHAATFDTEVFCHRDLIKCSRADLVRSTDSFAEFATGFTLVMAQIEGERYYGSSICSIADKFDPHKGTMLALDKIMKQASSTNVAKLWQQRVDKLREHRKESRKAVLTEIVA